MFSVFEMFQQHYRCEQEAGTTTCNRVKAMDTVTKAAHARESTTIRWSEIFRKYRHDFLEVPAFQRYGYDFLKEFHARLP